MKNYEVEVEIWTQNYGSLWAYVEIKAESKKEAEILGKKSVEKDANIDFYPKAKEI